MRDMTMSRVEPVQLNDAELDSVSGGGVPGTDTETKVKLALLCACPLSMLGFAARVAYDTWTQ